MTREDWQIDEADDGTVTVTIRRCPRCEGVHVFHGVTPQQPSLQCPETDEAIGAYVRSFVGKFRI